MCDTNVITVVSISSIVFFALVSIAPSAFSFAPEIFSPFGTSGPGDFLQGVQRAPGGEQVHLRQWRRSVQLVLDRALKRPAAARRQGQEEKQQGWRPRLHPRGAPPFHRRQE